MQGNDRRAFLKNGMLAAGAATLGAGLLPEALGARLLPGGAAAVAAGAAVGRDAGALGPVTKGEVAILRFLQALEQVEADLWIQYSELGGTQDNEVSGVNGGNPLYAAALQILDGDMPQYIHDNTDDEISHAAFLGKYLESKGAESANLQPFRHLPSSKATGANQSFGGDGGRLPNLPQPTIATNFSPPYPHLTNP